MRNVYDEIKLIGMLLTAEASLYSIQQIINLENLYDGDVTITACLDTAVSMVDCARKRMAMSLSSDGIDD